MAALRELQQLTSEVQRKEYSQGDLADLALAMRNAAKMMEEIGKKCKNVGWAAENNACYNIVQMDPNNPERAKPIVTEHLEAFAASERICTLPTFDKNPQELYKFMEFLGVPENLVDRGKVITTKGEKSTKIVDLHWPGVMGYLDDLEANGYGMPPGLENMKTYPRLKLDINVKRSKPLLEVEERPQIVE